MALWDELSEPLARTMALASVESDLPDSSKALTDLIPKCLVACSMVEFSNRLPPDLSKNELPLFGAYVTIKVLFDTRKLSAVESDILTRTSDYLRSDPYLRIHKLPQLGGGYEAADAKKAAVEAAKAKAEAEFEIEEAKRAWLRQYPIGSSVRFRFGAEYDDGKDERLNKKYYPWYQGRVEGVSDDGRSLIVRETNRSLWDRFASGSLTEVGHGYGHEIERI